MENAEEVKREVPEREPRVGETVLFYGPAKDGSTQECAALVIYVQDPELGLVDLTVFMPNGGTMPVFQVAHTTRRAASLWGFR